MPTPEELAALSPQERAQIVAQAELEQAVEYGTYTANQTIFLDGTRAFNTGQAVPVSHVTRGVVDSSQVDKVPNAPKLTKAAVDAAAEKKGA